MRLTRLTGAGPNDLMNQLLVVDDNSNNGGGLVQLAMQDTMYKKHVIVHI